MSDSPSALIAGATFTAALSLFLRRRAFARSHETPKHETPKTYPIIALDTQRQHLQSVSIYIAYAENEDSWLERWLPRIGHFLRRRIDFEELTGKYAPPCKYAPRLVFEKEADMRSVSTWAMPPPVAPSRPFGKIRAAADAGCATELASGIWPALDRMYVRDLGPVVGLGCFAAAPISAGAALCEYTGIVRCDCPPAALALDDYAFALPVCDPDVVLSAERMGGVARLLNHSEKPNAEIRTLHFEGHLHAVVFSLSRIRAGEQITIHCMSRSPAYVHIHSRQHARSNTVLRLLLRAPTNLSPLVSLFRRGCLLAQRSPSGQATRPGCWIEMR